MLRYETFSSGFRLKKCTFDPTAVHSPCSFANLRLEISRFLVRAAQGFSEVRGSLCSHVVFVTPPPPRTLSSVGSSLSPLASLPPAHTPGHLDMQCCSFLPLSSSVFFFHFLKLPAFLFTISSYGFATKVPSFSVFI